MTAVGQRSSGRSRRRTTSASNGPRSASNRRKSASTGRRSAQPAGAGKSSSEWLRIRRFDADRQDREISLRQALAAEPGRRQLLWIDVLGPVDAEGMAALGKRFDLDSQTRRALEDPAAQPNLAVHGSYVQLSVAAEPGANGHPPSPWLHAVASRNVVITRRVGSLAMLDEIDERIKRDTTVGAIEGAEFVALLLDAVVTTYLAAVDEIEDQIDRLDERSLRDTARRQVLEDLVKLRRRIAGLRRALARHRSLFAALTGPDIRQIVGAEAATGFQAVEARFEGAVTAIEACRTSLLGSFDVYMTRTAQRTSDVMKVLTIATVLLLPGSLIAGLLGMNVIVPLDKEDPMSFWLVLAGVALLAAVVLAAARWRRWI